jgi:hypothetical protein
VNLPGSFIGDANLNRQACLIEEPVEDVALPKSQATILVHVTDGISQRAAAIRIGSLIRAIHRNGFGEIEGLTEVLFENSDHLVMDRSPTSEDR